MLGVLGLFLSLSLLLVICLMLLLFFVRVVFFFAILILHWPQLAPASNLSILMRLFGLTCYGGNIFTAMERPDVFFSGGIRHFHVFTDASGSYGCGGYFAPNWFSLQWPSLWADSIISVKELVLVVLAAALWGMHWRGLTVCFHSDNSAVVAMPSKWSVGPLSAYHLVR